MGSRVGRVEKGFLGQLDIWPLWSVTLAFYLSHPSQKVQFEITLKLCKKTSKFLFQLIPLTFAFADFYCMQLK